MHLLHHQSSLLSNNKKKRKHKVSIYQSKIEMIFIPLERFSFGSSLAIAMYELTSSCLSLMNWSMIGWNRRRWAGSSTSRRSTSRRRYESWWRTSWASSRNQAMAGDVACFAWGRGALLINHRSPFGAASSPSSDMTSPGHQPSRFNNAITSACLIFTNICNQ